MSPLKEEQLQIIRDERREQILEVALKLFARRGLIGTKLSMIAQETRISQGLLYHYFKSKDELFITLIEKAIQKLKEEVNHIYQLPGTPLEKLRNVARLNEEGMPYYMLIHQVRTSDGVPEQAKELIQQYSMETYVIDQLEPLFIEGQKIGELAPGDPRKLITCYFTVLSALMTLNIQEDDAYQMPEADLLLRIVTGRP
ncbi:TetR/AcrR family transcriptional regulator [Paenibacillus dokdonensis]|uniref:TetR/AcrR family transcriptional regulator n=1 Tax=Paenibacillus dokdonensis TaxID=2567944 RepID=A0ABU6GP38_9BACL|nr:TetR/AcrR family transcriptional regulator [Paenibacillus dokdonensis]MEC0239917.1 TetR/AcrR family transcriptional regulator [Paenibacillus dokdonensis]